MNGTDPLPEHIPWDAGASKADLARLDHLARITRDTASTPDARRQAREEVGVIHERIAAARDRVRDGETGFTYWLGRILLYPFLRLAEWDADHWRRKNP